MRNGLVQAVENWLKVALVEIHRFFASPLTMAPLAGVAAAFGVMGSAARAAEAARLVAFMASCVTAYALGVTVFVVSAGAALFLHLIWAVLSSLGSE